MATSTWHHALVAVHAMAGDEADSIAQGLSAPADPVARRRSIEAGASVRARAQRIVAERLRATLPVREAVPTGRAGRVLALFLAAQPTARRADLVRALAPDEVRAATAAAGFARAQVALRPVVLRWFVCALRGGALPSLRSWDELVAELAGEVAASDPVALRIERSLRVAGLREASVAVARAIAEAT